MKKSWFPWIIASIFFIFFILLVLNLNVDRSYWFDESFSFLQAKRSFMVPDGMGYTIASQVDVHPPGFYVVLHVWMKLFGESAPMIRALSVLFGLGSLYIILRLTKLFYPDKYKAVFSWFAILFIFASVNLHYFTEARMYAMGLFFCLLSFYYLITLGKNIWRVVGFVLSTAVLLYIHYYTIFFILGELIFFYFFYYRRFDDEVKITTLGIWAITFLMMIPAVFFFFAQRARVAGMWFQESNWYSMISTYYYSFFHSNVNYISDINSVAGFVFLLVCFMFVFGYTFNVKNKDERKLALFLLGWYLLVPFLGMIVNLFFKVYHHRFFFFTGWILIFLVARSISYFVHKYQITKRKWLYAITVSVLIMMVCATVLFNYINYMGTQPIELRQVNEFLIEESGYHGDSYCNEYRIPVVHESPFSMLPSMFYLPKDCYVNYVYSELNEKQFASAGGDVIPRGQVLRNRTELSQFSKYYYLEHDGSLRIKGFDYEVVFVTDGLNVTLATRQESQSSSSLSYSREEYLMSLNGTCRMGSDCFINNSLKGCSKAACNWCCDTPEMLGGCTLLYCMTEEDVRRLNLT